MIATLLDRYFIKQPRLRRFITRLLEGDKETEVSLLGTSLCISSLREHGYLRASRLVKSSSLLRDELAVLLSLSAILPISDAFVDVGANVGIYSKVLYRLSHLFPQISFYAFEADPDTFKRLITTVRNTAIQAQLCAISDKEEELVFIRGAVSHVTTAKAHASRYSLSDEFVVQARRLDSLGLLGSRMMIKVDVEGHELHVLQGAEKLFSQNRVLAVYLDGCSDSRGVERFLLSYDFVLLDARTMLSAPSQTYSLLGLNRKKCVECGVATEFSPVQSTQVF